MSGDKSGAVSVSVIVCLAFCAICMVWLFRPVVVGNETMLNILITILATKFGTTVDYWLGSSSSSRTKDSTISELSTPTVKSRVALETSKEPTP